MYLYVSLLILAVLNCLLPINKQKNVSILLFLLMMLLCCLRAYDVGRDTHNYVFFAENPGFFNLAWGPIYWFFVEISQYTPLPATTFLSLMAFFTYIPLMVISSKYSMRPALSVLLYMIPSALYFYETFNLARQMLAISYILLAIVMIAENRRKLSIITAAIAFLLHPYTFIFFAFYFGYKFRFTQKKVYLLVLGSAFLGLFGIMEFIYSILEHMASIFEDSSFAILTKFAKYGDAGENIESNYSFIGQMSHIIPLSVVCLYGASNKSENNLYYKAMVIGCIITNLFIGVVYCERIASTFTIAQIIAIPYLYTHSTSREKNFYFAILVMTAFLYLYNLEQQSHDINVWTPYHTILN